MPDERLPNPKFLNLGKISWYSNKKKNHRTEGAEQTLKSVIMNMEYGSTRLYPIRHFVQIVVKW